MTPQTTSNIETTQPRYMAYVRIAPRAEALGAAADQQEADCQLTALRQYAAARGITIAAEYTEVAPRGTRPTFDVPSRLRTGDTLLVTGLSRLGRGDAAVDLLDRLRGLGIGVETLDGPVEHIHFYRAMAAYHADERRHIALGAIQAKVQAGHHVGRVPFGYRAETAADGRRTVVPDTVDAPTVRRAYHLYLATGSLRSVSEFLAEETGKLRTMSQVRRLLSDPAYTGAQIVGEARNDHSHTALVDRETWDEAQRLRAAHVRVGARPRNAVPNAAIA